MIPRSHGITISFHTCAIFISCRPARAAESLGPRLERVTYTNDENGYTIGKMKVYGRRDLVTVVGNILNPTPGEILKMLGEWTNHPKFGEQFKVVFYKCAVPASVKGIEKYLGSGLIYQRFWGIGPVMAKRIVGVFAKPHWRPSSRKATALSKCRASARPVWA